MAPAPARPIRRASVQYLRSRPFHWALLRGRRFQGPAPGSPAKPFGTQRARFTSSAFPVPRSGETSGGLEASRDAGATKRGGRGPSASLRVNKARPYDAMQVNISEVDDGKEKAGEVPGSDRDAPTGVPDRIGAGGVNSRRGIRRNMRGGMMVAR